MELSYEEQLHKELVLLITSKLLDAGIEGNKHQMYDGMTSLWMPFTVFDKSNPKLMADCIMDGKFYWETLEQIKSDNLPDRSSHQGL